MKKLNTHQRQQSAEVLGNLSIAVVTVGAINPLFTQNPSLILFFQLLASIIAGIRIEVTSLYILKR